MKKMQFEILVPHGLLRRREHAGRNERRNNIQLHVGQRANPAVGGDIDAFELRRRTALILLHQADEGPDRRRIALYPQPQAADSFLFPDCIELPHLRKHDLRMLQKPQSCLGRHDAAVGSAEDLVPRYPCQGAAMLWAGGILYPNAAIASTAQVNARAMSGTGKPKVPSGLPGSCSMA